MRKVLGFLLIVIVVLIGVVMTRPNTFHIERSATMGAPASVVFDHINDFHQWTQWSPWEHLDPGMTKTFSGAATGTGAGYHWSGNDKVGEGNMTITESSPNERVRLQLDFIKPFKASNVTTFALTPEGEGTRVTWSMDGHNNFISKCMSLFTSMDKMVGPDFEKGLAALKTVSEAPAAVSDSTASSPSAPASNPPASQ